MLRQLLGELSDAAGQLASYSVRLAEQRMRRLLATVALLQLAICVAWVAFLFFAGSFFFHLASMANLVGPAAYTGIAVLAISLLLGLLAMGNRS